MVVAAGSRSASTTLRVTAVDDVEADGGETIVIGTSLAGRAATEATLTLREPAGPLLVVHVDGEALAPSSACGGFGRLCLPETSLQAGLTLELRHPPAHAYRKCRVEVGDGPNTARQAQRSRGRRHDYDVFASDPSRQGYHLNSGEDRTLSVSGWWLHVEHDGEEEGPESLTLRGKCGGSPNNRAHRDLRWAPTTVWIADVPWPKLTVERPSGGRVSGEGVDCGSGGGVDCEESYATGSAAELSAAADAHHRFAGWGGACSGSAASCTVELDADRRVSASFEATSHLLTVERPEHGRVTGSGIDCGGGSSDCTEQYDHGAEVELTATADANHELASWSGACEGAEASCALRMESNLAAGADFALVRRTLTVERPANGHVAAKGVDCGSGTRAACSTSKAHGSVVVAVATADEGYEFESWTGACGAVRWPKCQLKLDGDLTVGATFKRAKRTLTVAVAGIGKVTGTGIDCGADCAQDYDYGTWATLTAAPGEGQDFERWEGACAGTATGTVCRLEMKEARSATARFKPQKRTLAVTKTAGGSVSSAPAGISCGADCAEDYDYGTAVELTAAAESGYDFASWGGDCSASASSTCELTMDEARTASASFAAECAAATVAHCALDRADSGTMASGACTAGYNGSCSYACNDGVWSRSGNTCVPNPQCGDPSSAASACKPGAYGEAPGDRGVWAACSSQTSCEAGAPGWSTTRVDGKCGTAASPCAARTENNRVVGTEETTWRCAGVDGQRTLTCTGTAGAWNWSCTNGTVTRSDCTREFGKNSASCGGLADPATDDDGCRECNAGYEECGGACVANCGANSTRNSACGCDCDTGYRADGGVCKKLYTLTVTKTAGGDVSSSPAGIDCGTDCTEKYVDGTTVKLTTAPDANRKLSAWSGACSASASTTCAVLLDGDKTVGAAFVWEKRKLTVTRPGNGHVAASGISCGSGGRTDCTEEYDHGTEVTLSTTADSGYDFASWGGDCSASAASSTCRLTMEEARTASASFAAECAAATVAHCALDRADSGATVSGACASGHNGSCRYACGNGAWSRSVNTCVPNPQCGDPSSVASACKPGTRSEPPDDLGIWAVCSSPTSCEAGAPGWSTTRVDGKCGTAASPCAAGTEKDRVVRPNQTTWRCEGVDGQRTLTCFGTAGAWNWSCTNGTVTRSDCTLGFEENSASCGGLADPATDDDGCRECNAGYEECSGACVANCGDNSTRNSTTCGCDCNTGYEACSGACVANCGANSTRNSATCGCDCNTGYEACSGACVANCGAYSTRNSATCGCDCNTGYEACSGACVANCGANSTRNSTTCGCDCNTGYETCTPQGSQTGACYASCGANEERGSDCGCACKSGYRRDNGSCTACGTTPETCHADATHGSVADQSSPLKRKWTCKVGQDAAEACESDPAACPANQEHHYDGASKEIACRCKSGYRNAGDGSCTACGTTPENCHADATHGSVADQSSPPKRKWTCKVGQDAAEACESDPVCPANEEHYYDSASKEIKCRCISGHDICTSGSTSACYAVCSERREWNGSCVCIEKPVCGDALADEMDEMKGTCTKGRLVMGSTTVTAADNGACGSAAHSCTSSAAATGKSRTARVDGACASRSGCATGTEAGRQATYESATWRCVGSDGEWRWQCPGTKGKATWQCTNGVSTKTCNLDRPADDKSCRLVDPGGTASCSWWAGTECADAGGEWIEGRPERARTCRSSSCFGHRHSCTAEPGGTCSYKAHDAILCTNHKDRTCRPHPAQPGHCLTDPFK